MNVLLSFTRFHDPFVSTAVERDLAAGPILIMAAERSFDLVYLFGGSTPFMTLGDLKELWVRTIRTVTDKGTENPQTVRRGATLVCCIGATIGKMGKANVLSAFNQQINAVERHLDTLDAYDLEALKFFRKIISKRGSSTRLPILTNPRFNRLKLLLLHYPCKSSFLMPCINWIPSGLPLPCLFLMPRTSSPHSSKSL